MSIYDELGVRTLINAAGTVTRYGGSLMAPEVLDSMRGASQQFCHLDEVQKKVGERIASMLKVEAAYVTSSAACGLVLTTAACMAGTDSAKVTQLPDTTGMKHEIIIQKIHRIAYDQAIRVAGGTLIEIDDQGTPPTEDMRRAINENTAAIFFMATVKDHPASVPLAEVVAMARAASVPVIVDAASECPPVSTLTRFWEAGADLIIFSGGKSIMGPQSTGLVIGRKDLIAGCAANGVPFATVGRPMKVSREEMIGFMKALELYLARDHEADTARWTAQLDYIEGALQGIPNITLGRFTKSETYTIPLLYIRPTDDANFTRAMIADGLEAGDPPIVVGQHFTEDSITINPHNLQPGQEQTVADRCEAVLAQIG